MADKTEFMTAKLVAEEGLLKELVLSFEEGDQWIIGRDPDASQLLVEDPAASRKHVSCRKTSQGIVVENLSSTNPLLVNDEPVVEPRLLQHGDLVKIGDSLFRFYAEDEVHLFEEKTETNIPEADQAPFPSHLPDSPETPSSETPKKGPDTIFEEIEDQSGLAQINFDLMETGRWLLKVVGGPNNGAEFSMQTGNSYTIGTDPNTCDIVFYDNSVSRQHARISISNDDKITIEDLKSRNGTRIDGELITSSQPLPFNTLVSIGTTSFVVYDREGEMQTIMSPLLPSIVKALQKERIEEPVERATSGGTTPTGSLEASSTPENIAPVLPKKPSHTIPALIVTGVLVGLFGIIGLAVQTLFVQEPIVIEQPVDTTKMLDEALTPFSGVRSSFNKTTGRLLLVGHVLTPTDKTRLLNSLQGMKFVKETDDSGVIIDEYLWNEANQILSKNPNWKGVTVYASTPGHFTLSGYLQSREQAQLAWDYLTRNFPSLDNLDNKIVVEEDVIDKVNRDLFNQGITTVNSQMSNGELTLSGTVDNTNSESFNKALAQFQSIPGVRSVRNNVTQQAVSDAIVDISDRYLVSGLSRADSGRLNVIINGRILAEGDALDGMTVTEVQQNVVFLEKNGTKYRINISR